AEPVAETDMQVAVLKYLRQNGYGVAIPAHWPAPAAAVSEPHGFIAAGVCDDGAATLDWVRYLRLDGSDMRVRAYEFLPGKAGSRLPMSVRGWLALGRMIADLDSRLASFEHQATRRYLLWDTTQIDRLRPMLSALDDPGEQSQLENYLDEFERLVVPALRGLPHQVIHNDLSPSNFLVAGAANTPAGILDFGD